MHLHWASFLLAFAAGTIALNANQDCGDNKDCASNCEEGRYHIVADGNSTFFGCTTDKVQYYITMDNPHGEQFCQSVSGKQCSQHTCIVLYEKRREYHKACDALPGGKTGCGKLTDKTSWEDALKRC
ncbi:hypothetical protein N7541_003812 [Penicillium brevicompactum]|uniref:Uncharacterized protein n=1 Tax=Penicillium brevicompactum TaxID=5074 RepID=A0A9W9RSG0_PENBR|nr:hypothetical protein N7541_003812 [Penicillium brevicompactum]